MFEWRCHEMRKWTGRVINQETETVTGIAIGIETGMMEAGTVADTEEEANGAAGDDSVEEEVIKDLENTEEKANGANEITKDIGQKASSTWYFNGNDTQLVPGPRVFEKHVANSSDDEMIERVNQYVFSPIFVRVELFSIT